jgi:hypothetical protein
LYQPDTNTIVTTFGQGGALLFTGFPPTTRTRFIAEETRPGKTRLFVAGQVKKDASGFEASTFAIVAQVRRLSSIPLYFYSDISFS